MTWIDVTDASKYCGFYGKRLPNDWEWQRAAQGDEDWSFPWGSEWDATRVAPQYNGRTRPPPPNVGSNPGSSSPFGVQDTVGVVWQWTNVFTDEHTRAGLVRGGSYYRPLMAQEPGWYFPNVRNDTSGIPLPNVPVTIKSHNKILLMAPSYDRHGTVGFRCVAEAAEM